MKTCAYCGLANDTSSLLCAGCGTAEFTPVSTQPISQSSFWPWNKRERIEEALSRPWPQKWDTWLTRNMAHYSRFSPAERANLQDIVKVFIAEKIWEGCSGLRVTELMKVTVAAQAALVLLHLKHDFFSQVLSIALFPSTFALPRTPGEGGRRWASGVASDGGSVFLAWDATLIGSRDHTAGWNVVVHEFAHQLDFLDGYTNGTPLLRGGERTRLWCRVMAHEYEQLRRQVHEGSGKFLGAYATTSPTEFFAVASERFFLLPARLQQLHPDLFQVLAEYYGVDPRRWFSHVDAPPVKSSTSEHLL